MTAVPKPSTPRKPKKPVKRANRARHTREWIPMSETWKAIEGWPYEVSDAGRVRRLKGYKARAMVLNPRHVIGKGSTKPYARVTLVVKQRRRCVFVHRLVLESFKGMAPSPQHQCNHINGEKLDNRPGNLEWVTRRQNIRHALDTGLRTGRHSGKIPEAEVPRIRQLRASGVLTHVIAAEYGVHVSTIRYLVRRSSWAHVP